MNRTKKLSDDTEESTAAPAYVGSAVMNGKRPALNDGAMAFKKSKASSFRLRSLNRPDETYRTNDEIHVTIHFCPVMKALIDTPQFQRLRRLKQLGVADLVYMNANHTRFEHSLGVSFLAQKMCRRLMHWQPNLGITEKDVLCVTLAGLLHDLGHGPYSHIFEGVPDELSKYLDRNPHLRAQYRDCPKTPANWKHEDASLMMIDAALEQLGLVIDMNNLDKPLRQTGDGIEAESMRVFDRLGEHDPQSVMTSRDWVFVKEMILGAPLVPIERPLGENDSGFVGRPKRRHEFLYDIVSNRFSGLDVDKMDYYARDAKRTLWKGAIEIRLIEEAVVAWGNCPYEKVCPQCSHRSSFDEKQHLMICYPAKMQQQSAGFFHERFLLHSKVYSHKTIDGASFMIRDILAKADPFFRINTSSELVATTAAVNMIASKVSCKSFPVSRAMVDAQAYLKLDDGIIDAIYATDVPELSEARRLIGRFRSRDLYKLAANKSIAPGNNKWNGIWERCKRDESEFKRSILAIRGHHMATDGSSIGLDEADFIVHALSNHHGKKQEDPTAFMRFLPKDETHKLTHPVMELPLAASIAEDGYAAKVFEKRFIRVFCRNEDKLNLLRHVFDQWEAEIESELDMTGYNDSEDEPDTVPLTQESFLSPTRNHPGQVDEDPSPVPTNLDRKKVRNYAGFA